MTGLTLDFTTGVAAGVLGASLLWFLLYLFRRNGRSAREAAVSASPETTPLEAPAAAAPEPGGARAGTDPAPALQLLAAFQREGRFVDFLQEDVAGYSDAEVGGAARVVHEGCRRALAEYLELEPIRTEAEGAPVTLGADFDPGEVRLTGTVPAAPPYQGRVAHHGWRAVRVRLPALGPGQAPEVVAPAEVEVGG